MTEIVTTIHVYWLNFDFEEQEHTASVSNTTSEIGEFGTERLQKRFTIAK